MELIIKRNGLSPIPTRSTTEPVADVVFVHGLMGHPRNTWSASDGQITSEQPAGKPQKRSIFSKLRKPKTDSGHKDTAEPSKGDVFWPSDFLARDLESARIFTYGYNADVVTGLFQSSNSNNIYEHTMTMVARLKRELEHHNVPIVFVVHSLGGVIVKDAINNSDFLRDRTKLVIFFGTPHRGSATAGWGELAGSFTRYFLFLDTNAGLVGDLDLNSQTLDRIHRDFVRNSQASGIHIHSFQESRALGGTRTKIVENFSSRMDIGGLETVESIDADHRNMAKFNKDTDEGYEAVCSVLRSFVRQTMRGTVQQPPPPAPVAPTDLHTPSHDQPRRPPPTPSRQIGSDDGPQMARSTDTPSFDTPQLSEVQFLDAKDDENIRKFSSDYPASRSGVVERFPGTCEWIVQHADFKRWSKAGDISTPLWISGHPGMGKTVMSKFLLDHFEQMDPPHQTVYFFFSDRDDDKKTAVSFLKAVIHQLIQHSECLYHKHVKAKLAAFGDRLYASFGMLWDVFFNITQDPVLGPTLCVIDALDECEAVSRQGLISQIGKHFSLALAPETSSKASKTFKLLLTSRPYEDILANWSRFHIIHLRAELEDPQINSDIGLFVDSEVERLGALRGYSEEVQDTVRLALVHGADGMFLWAALMVKLLETTPVSRVRERLASLPSGIDALYDRILSEVPEDLVSTVSAILKWAAFAFRPLSIDELGVACALDSSPYESIASIPEEIRTSIRGDLGLCGPILKVKDDHVHLVHQTTKEYLVRRCVTDAAIGTLLPTPQDAHSQLALACMRFINSAEVDAFVAEIESDSEPEVVSAVPSDDEQESQKSRKSQESQRSQVSHNSTDMDVDGDSQWAPDASRGPRMYQGTRLSQSSQESLRSRGSQKSQETSASHTSDRSRDYQGSVRPRGSEGSLGSQGSQESPRPQTLDLKPRSSGGSEGSTWSGDSRRSESSQPRRNPVPQRARTFSSRISSKSEHSQALREPGPFADYASSYWGSHVRETGKITEDDPLWLELSLALESEGRRRWLADTTIECQRNLRPFEPHLVWRQKRTPPRLSPVHILFDCECENASALYTRSGQYMASAQDSCERILLHMATERGYHQVMIDLLTAEPESANLYQRRGTEGSGRRRQCRLSTNSVASTPLHIAATRGDVAAIEILLRSGASVDRAEMREECHEINGFGGTTVIRARTALHCATTGNHLAAVRRLLDGSASIDVLETHEEVFSHYPSGNASMSESWTALHAAVSLGFVAISRLLLQKGAATVTGSDGKVYAPYKYSEEEASSAEFYGMEPQWPNGRVAVQGRLR